MSCSDTPERRTAWARVRAVLTHWVLWRLVMVVVYVVLAGMCLRLGYMWVSGWAAGLALFWLLSIADDGALKEAEQRRDWYRFAMNEAVSTQTKTVADLVAMRRERDEWRAAATAAFDRQRDDS